MKRRTRNTPQRAHIESSADDREQLVRTQAQALRCKIRSATRWSIGLGVYFAPVGLPVAGNSGKGGTKIIERARHWSPWITLLGASALLAGAAALYRALRIVRWEAQLPRGGRGRRK